MDRMLKNIKPWLFKKFYWYCIAEKQYIFSGTIKNNIKWGDSNASDEEIIECAKDAQAYDFIINTDNGFDTELGQMGVNVSGGQKQRISIARTLLKKF